MHIHGVRGTRGRTLRCPTVAVVLVLVLAGTGAACSKSKKKATPLAPPTTTVPARFPLTGLPVTDAPKVLRPALNVKIENDAEARPQSGLDKADVVYEEIAEGGITRFLAVYQSRDAAPIGPVRSVRPTDPPLVTPLGGLFAYSGGTPKFVDLLHKAPVVDIGDDKEPGLYQRRSGRVAPHNLYSSTTKLYAKATAAMKPPPPLAPFLDPGQPFAGAGAVPAAHLGLTLGSTKADFDYDAASRTYKRSTNGTVHTVEGGATLAPTNVVVQFTTYVPSPGDVDAAGTQVMIGQVTGSGEAWILSGGLLVKGRWSKPAATAVTVYTDATGAPLALTPGQTFVELPLPDAAAGAAVR